jgi:hypothetical protein
MKISEFKINKKIIFNNGQVKVEKNNLNNKEVDFKELDLTLLKGLQDGILSKISDSKDNTEVLFLTIPYLTDLEMDISFEEFKKMLELPSKEFCQLCEAIIDEINLIIETSKSIEQLNKKSLSIEKKAKKITSK